MFLFKILKTKSYFSRFRVKWKRQRNNLTDYKARKHLVMQDKRKYESSKYRIVIRFTKRNIICQHIHNKLEGDYISTSIYSKNLRKIGITWSLTSFPAAYILGILFGKILKTKFHDKKYYDSFLPKIKSILDVGLSRVTTGHRMFAMIKGLIDMEIDIPCNEKKFPGYSNKKGLDRKIFKNRITGKHIEEYMLLLKSEDQEKYKKYFLKIDNKIKSNDYMKIFQNTLSKIISL